MKVSKRTNRICIALVIAGFIAYGFYQVVYATNESSYRFGYDTTVKTARCIATQIRTDNGDDCNRGIISNQWVCGDPNNPDSDNALSISPYTGFHTTTIYVTNQTACNDGVFNGFAHWCSTDVKGCAAIIKEDGVQLGIKPNS
jgi:hypothetical protein